MMPSRISHRLNRLAGALVLVLGVPQDASATDCPLAAAPYSSNMPVADIMAEPAARDVVWRLAPDVLAPFATGGRYVVAPTFGRITTPAKLLSQVPDGAARAAALDAALKTVRVTRGALLERCARYDTVRPRLPAGLPRPALLLFDKITGFRDAPSVDAATRAMERLAAAKGWSVFRADNGAIFNAADLRRFDAVVWNNVSGDALTLGQRAAFRSWMERGGGFVGIHGAGGDPVYFWDWYADELLGTRFLGHTAVPHFQAARVKIDDPESWIAQGVQPAWTMTEEWYSFTSNPRLAGAKVIATLDETTYTPTGRNGADYRMGDHPIVWSRCVASGRAFYTAIGHLPEAYEEPNSARLLERGIAWAMALGGPPCKPQAHREPQTHRRVGAPTPSHSSEDRK